jgi:S1-C subfamily serine protease
MTSFDGMDSQTLKLPKGIKTGAVIMGVDAFSPAGKAGLKKLFHLNTEERPSDFSVFF